MKLASLLVAVVNLHLYSQLFGQVCTLALTESLEEPVLGFTSQSG